MNKRRNLLDFSEATITKDLIKQLFYREGIKKSHDRILSILNFPNFSPIKKFLEDNYQFSDEPLYMAVESICLDEPDYYDIHITDEIVLKFTLSSNSSLSPNIKKILNFLRYKPIKDYLIKRFPDNTRFNLKELIYRIKNHIEEVPKCPICGNPCHFEETFYRVTCLSSECYRKSQVATSKNNYQEKYGVDCAFQVQEIKDKIAATNIERYGNICSLHGEEQIKKKKETWTKNLGVDNPSKSEKIKEKKVETCLKNHNVEYPLQNKEILERAVNTNILKYGVKSPMQVKEFIDKGNNSKKVHKTFNTSKIEENCYVWLCEEYGDENVCRQYKAQQYPWRCDFYIKPIELFIEIQGNWTHGPHPFDENNPEDIALLESYKLKAEKHQYYKRVVIGWTKTDIKKRNKAKENNLNFLEIFGSNYDKEYFMEVIKNHLSKRFDIDKPSEILNK